MKWYTCLFLLATTLLLPSYISAQGTHTAPCAVMAWSPETFSFYGDRATVAQKLASLDRDIMKHRTWAFVLESKEGAKLTFFEVTSDKTMVELSSMSGVSMSDLVDRISERLLKNDERHCAGQLTKRLIQSYSKGQMRHASIQRPTTVGNAFEYAANDFQGDYNARDLHPALLDGKADVRTLQDLLLCDICFRGAPTRGQR